MLSIRMVSRAKTITALAASAEESVRDPAPEQGIVRGEVPLTPIQQWFFSSDFSDPSFWTHALLMEPKQPLKSEFLEAAAIALVTHHDALRMRFIQEENGWRQVNLAEVRQSPFQRIDLSHIPPLSQRELLEAVAKTAEWIDVERGLLFSVILFDFGAEHPGYLLLVTHHLVADGLSWQILLEDLQTAYRQVSAGQEILLPQKTTSFRQWSQALREYAHADRVREEIDFWVDWLRTEIKPLPVDYPAGDRTEATSRTLNFELDSEETRSLLHQAPAVWQCGMEDLLLTALALNLSDWSGEHRILIDRDRHGREHFLEGIDISRTVGWFTSLSPVLLEVVPESTTAQALLSVREQLEKIPFQGFHYSLLRYHLEPGSSMARALEKRPVAPLIFNYLGRIDQVLCERPLFVLAEDRIRRGFNPTWARPYEMAIDVYIVDGRLHLNWGYSGARYQRTTIERLGQGVMQTLRALMQ